MKELSQTFRFSGSTAGQLAHVLATAPMIGEGSIFGSRTAAATSDDGDVRRALGFEPAPLPLLRFDVEMTQKESKSGRFVLVEFTQPNKRRPYLAGQFVWLLKAEPDAAVLQEEINTRAALELVDRPLHGSILSPRRFLFFKGGHQALMKETARNISTLLSSATSPGE